MGRDYGKEIDGINEQLIEIKQLLVGFFTPQPKKETPESGKHIETMSGMHPDLRLSELMEELCDKANEDGDTGCVTYLGVYSSGGRQSNWIRNQVDADQLLELIESKAAARVLNCIGNNDRLNMLLALLRAPRTVAGLVEECGYNTTGQVYHHLKPLLAADLVKEDEHNRGNYVVQPHRVQGIIMLLAGISDMLDTEYTQGNWGIGSEIHPGATMLDERYMVTALETEKIITTFFTSLDPLILKAFPPKEKKKLVILRVIAGQFEACKRYPEKEVNRILKSIYKDFASIRRYLIMYGFMDRTDDCSEYWVKGSC